jgi:hypothetical protein
MGGGQYPGDNRDQQGGHEGQQGGYQGQQGGHQQQQYGGQQQYPPNPYGQAQHGYNQGYAMKPHRGTMLLVFSILGIVFCIIFAIVAFFMARTDLEEMKRGIMDKSGEGMTTAAMWISAAAMILAVLGIVLYAFLFAAYFSSGAAGSF